MTSFFCETYKSRPSLDSFCICSFQYQIFLLYNILQVLFWLEMRIPWWNHQHLRRTTKTRNFFGGKKKLLFTILTRQITRRVCMDKLDSNSSATHRIWTWKNAQNDGASIPLHENQQQRNKNDDERTKLQKQLPIPKHFNCVITFTIFFFSPQNRRRFFR